MIGRRSARWRLRTEVERERRDLDLAAGGLARGRGRGPRSARAAACGPRPPRSRRRASSRPRGRPARRRARRAAPSAAPSPACSAVRRSHGGMPSAARWSRAAAAALGGAALEALDATAGVDQLLPARVERVAVGADLDVDLGLGRARRELVAARAADVGLDVFRMDFGLHRFTQCSDVRAVSRAVQIPWTQPIARGRARRDATLRRGASRTRGTAGRRRRRPRRLLDGAPASSTNRTVDPGAQRGPAMLRSWSSPGASPATCERRLRHRRRRRARRRTARRPRGRCCARRAGRSRCRRRGRGPRSSAPARRSGRGSGWRQVRAGALRARAAGRPEASYQRKRTRARYDAGRAQALDASWCRRSAVAARLRALPDARMRAAATGSYSASPGVRWSRSKRIHIRVGPGHRRHRAP